MTEEKDLDSQITDTNNECAKVWNRWKDLCDFYLLKQEAEACDENDPFKKDVRKLLKKFDKMWNARIYSYSWQTWNRTLKDEPNTKLSVRRSHMVDKVEEEKIGFGEALANVQFELYAVSGNLIRARRDSATLKFVFLCQTSEAVRDEMPEFKAKSSQEVLKELNNLPDTNYPRGCIVYLDKFGDIIEDKEKAEIRGKPVKEYLFEHCHYSAGELEAYFTEVLNNIIVRKFSRADISFQGKYGGDDDESPDIPDSSERKLSHEIDELFIRNFINEKVDKVWGNYEFADKAIFMAFLFHFSTGEKSGFESFIGLKRTAISLRKGRIRRFLEQLFTEVFQHESNSCFVDEWSCIFKCVKEWILCRLKNENSENKRKLISYFSKREPMKYDESEAEFL